MVKTRSALLALVCALIANDAVAQGLLPAGTFWGNPNSFSSTPSAATGNAMLNQAFCNTATSILYNTAGVWGCSTTFPYSQLSGAPQAVDQTFTTPGAVSTVTLTNTPLPTAKIQVSVSFDGVWQHPSTWSISGAVITFNATIPTNTQEVYVKWGSTASAVGVNTIGGMSGAVLCGSGLDCGTISQTITSQGPVTANVLLYGAKGDCSTDDTTAFQNAVNAAAAAGGQGVVYIPPVASGKCYLVGAINQTQKGGIIIRGNGDNSLIKPNGFSSTNHNWWDLSGSDNTRFEYFKVLYDGSHKPAVVFFAAAVNGVNGDILTGISFDHVTVDMHVSRVGLTNATRGGAIFFGLALAYITTNTARGAAGLNCNESTWIQRENAVAQADLSLKQAVVVLDGINTRGLASDYVTVTVAAPGTQSIILNNCNFIDGPAGFGGGVGSPTFTSGTLDNNAGLVAVTVGQFVMNMGSVQCTCDSDVVMWTNSEGMAFNNTVMKATDNTPGSVNYWINIGGGNNGFLSLTNVLMSIPTGAGACLGTGAPTGAATGGIAYLNVMGPDLGGGCQNSGAPTGYFMQPSAGCVGYTVTNNWLATSWIQMLSGANNLVLCGSIDSHTILQNPGTRNVNGGNDNSVRF